MTYDNGKYVYDDLLRENLLVLKYAEARPHFKTGNIIAYSNMKNPATALICKASGGMSHIGAIVCFDLFKGQPDRVWVRESNFSTQGVVLEPLSERIRHHAGDGRIYWLPMDILTEEQKYVFAANAMEAASHRIKYDVLGLVQQGLHIFMPFWFKKGAEFEKKMRYCAGDTYKAFSDIRDEFTPLPFQSTPFEVFSIFRKRTTYKPIIIEME